MDHPSKGALPGSKALFDDGETLNDLAVLEYMKGKTEQAVFLLQQALEMDPANLDALINLADVFLEKKLHSGLYPLAEALLRYHGNNEEASKAAKRIYEALESKDRFVDAFRQSIGSVEKTANVTEEHSGSGPEEWESEDMILPGRKKIITHSRQELLNILRKVCHHPHGDLRKGQLVLEKSVFENSDRETNIFISPGARIDLTGTVTVGPWCMIGWGTVILTHDHFHEGRRKPLIRVQEERGVRWRDKKIGRDVWLHGCTILAQAAEIPDGVVVGAGSVLTVNPGPYEIWAGNPAKKVGEREDIPLDD